MRILIAGLGAIGQRHARNLRRLYGPTLQLLAYRRRRLRHIVTDAMQMDTTRDVEEELALTVFDLEEALAARPDAVFVCTPSSQHLTIAERAAGAGCHLFIEKPVSHTMDGMGRLRETVLASDVVAAVGCQWRHHPVVQWLRQQIQGETAIGRPISAEIEYAEFLPDWHPYEDYRISYAARSDLGGGVVLTQIHDYDLAWWLFGAPTSVRASGGRLSNLEIDVEDTIDAHFVGGTVPVRVRQSLASRPPRRIITVQTDRQTIRADLFRAEVTSDAADQPLFRARDFTRNDMFLDELTDFLTSLSRDTEPLAPLADGIAVLEVALAARQAMFTGHEVHIP